MFDARNCTPLPPAIAAGTIVRVDGGLLCAGRMARSIVSTPTCRGVTR